MNIPKLQQSMRLNRGDTATLHCGAAEPRGGDQFVTPQHDLCVAAAARFWSGFPSEDRMGLKASMRFC